MSRALERLRRALGRARRNEDGNATIEFVIMVPLLFTIFFMGIEAGVLQMRQIMLDRALDITIRDLRVGAMGDAPEFSEVRDAVCDNAFLIPNCRENFALELTPVDLRNWTAPDFRMACVDRDAEVAPVNVFTQGGSVRPTLVRACLIVDLIFPTSRLGLQLTTDPQGGYQIFSTSFYINEPEV